MSTPHDTQAGVVEQRGIDLVPASERHGRPRDLFFMWLGTNTNVFYIINGAIVISLGLNFLQSIVVILVGNLAFFLLGLTSLQGPRTGTATFAINRAAFGPNGGRVLAFFNWLTLVGFEGSGLALAVIALLTLVHTLGWSFADFGLVQGSCDTARGDATSICSHTWTCNDHDCTEIPGLCVRRLLCTRSYLHIRQSTTYRRSSRNILHHYRGYCFDGIGRWPLLGEYRQ